MSADSYSLEQVAEILGVTPRTLQRRIQEGAFPGRFLAPGIHGLETRIPGGEVRRVLENMRRVDYDWRSSGPRASAPSTRHSDWARPLTEVGRGWSSASRAPGRDSLVPYPAEDAEVLDGDAGQVEDRAGLDLVALERSIGQMVREEREATLSALRTLMLERDETIHGLRRDLREMHQVMEAVVGTIEGLRRRLDEDRAPATNGDWVEMLIQDRTERPSVEAVDVVRELDALEALLGELGLKVDEPTE